MEDLTNLYGTSACVILLFNKDKVLLQLRDEHAPTAPNMWSFFGGAIDEGETPKQCVVRECFEELSYRLQDPIFCLARRFVHPAFDTEFIFFKEIEEKEIKSLELHEGKAMGWFTLAEIMLLPMVEDKKAILPYIFQYREKYHV